MVLATAVTVAKKAPAIQIRIKNHLEIQAKFLVWLLLNEEGKMYIK